MKCLLLFCWMTGAAVVFGQQFTTFYPDGTVQSVTPLNEAGEFEGLGMEYYPDSKLAAEVPYLAGKVHGKVREYYPDGSLKLEHSFNQGRKEGRMYLYGTNGTIRMLALMEADSVLMSQRFDEQGRLMSEFSGWFEQPVDTSDLVAPAVWLHHGEALLSGKPNLAQVYILGFPSNLISFASPSGAIEKSGREDFPLLLTPNPGETEFLLYLRLRLSSPAQPGILKLLRLPVQDP